MLKWLFGRKEPGAKLLSLLSLWHLFETVDLNRPELADKLEDFALSFEQEFEASKALISRRANSGTAKDIDFIFDVLSRLPSPPAKPAPLPEDEKFSWEKGETGLGVVGKVVQGVRVAVQGRRIAPFEKRILELRRELAEELGKVKDKESPKVAKLREELKREEEGLQEELKTIDQTFRQTLTRVLLVYNLYDHCLAALAGVKSQEGLENLIARLRAPAPGERVLSLKALLRANWQPKTTSEALDFAIARAKFCEDERERRQAERDLEKIIRGETDAKELIEVIEPRLAEEGLISLQAMVLVRLAEVAPAVALERFAGLIGIPDEPPELKIAVVTAIGEKLLVFNPETAVNLLVKAMDDLTMEVRVSAARALARLPENTPTAVRLVAMNRLLFGLRDGDWEVREASARALNPKCYPEASPPLIETLLTETNPNAREFSAKSIGWNFPPQPETSEALIKALSDEDAAVRKASAEALVAQGQIPTDPETRLKFFCAKQDWGALVAQGKPAITCLLPLLKDQREEIRLNVVRTLGRVGVRQARDETTKEMVKHLCVALSDASQEVRRAVAKALGEIGDDSAVPALKSAIAKEGFQEVRAEMERAIRRLQG